MVERNRILDVVTYLVLIAGVAVVMLPLYVAFVASTQTQEQVMAAPMSLVPGDRLLGTNESIIEQLHARRERWGFNYVAMQGTDVIESFAPIVSALRGQ